jgi:UDP-2,3-diacylglucosamine pyrophosphatase LpxH
MIIVSDAHIDESRGNASNFFRMLEAIGKTDHDVVFLGDIFELWIAFPRYEKDYHKRFLAWCKARKQRRAVGFIEGNHEYFIAARRKKYFSWCSDAAARPDANGNLFCHGDQINPRDKNYLRFRKITKHQHSQIIARFLPFGPLIGAFLKHSLKHTNPGFRKHLPKEAIAAFAEANFKAGIHTIFVGHFHLNYQYRNSESNALYLVPAWLNAEQVILYEKETGSISSCHWRELQ